MIDLAKICAAIYEKYPRHVARRAALKSIMNALTRLHDGESGVRMEWEAAAKWLEHATETYSKSPAGNRGVYTPHATTFYNQARYLDDPREWQVVAPSEAAIAQGVKPGWLQ